MENAAANVASEHSNVNWKEISITAGIVFVVTVLAMIAVDEGKKMMEKKSEKSDSKKS